MSMTGAAGQLKLTIDHTKIASQLSDFPVLIHLGTSSGQNAVDTSAVFSTLSSDANRKKISVSTDSAGTQQLYVEIEKWDTANKQAWLWVKVPSVSSSTDTTLYLNYDPSMPENTNYVGNTGSTPANKVWSNNFVGVWHFAEQGTGQAGEYKDSTGKGHNGQGGGGSSWGKSPQRISSAIGDGGYFDGGQAGKWPVIKVNDADDLSITDTNHFTVSCLWNSYTRTFTGFPQNNKDGYIHWLGKQKAWNNLEWQFVLESIPVTDDSPGVARFYQFSPDGGYGAACDSYDQYNVNQWQYETGECDCTDSTHGTPNAYMNDARHNVGVTTWQDYGVNYKNTDSPMYIGSSTFTDQGEYNNCWYGQIDELQISNVSRSAAWVKASYYTDKDQLLTTNEYVSNVTPPVIIPPPIITPAPTNETAPIASFSASPTSGKYPLKVVFKDSSTGSITSRKWTFGDGYTSTSKNPTHTYSRTGTYTASLTVSNSVESNSKTMKITVTRR